MNTRRIVGWGLLCTVLSGCASMRGEAPHWTESCPGAPWVLANLNTRAPQPSVKSSCPAERLRLAAQLIANADTHADLARAHGLIESVENSTEVKHDAAFAGLYTLLEHQWLSLHHAQERIDRLQEQAHGEAATIEELNTKLQNLASIELAMEQKAHQRGSGL